MTNSIPEISEQSDVILIVGSNTGEAHPLVAKHVVEAQARGAKLIVIDPRMTEMANKADLWLRVPVGQNVPLISSLIHVIIRDNLHRADFIAGHVEGFDEIARAAREYSPERASALTGIPAQDIVAAAHMYAQAHTAALLYCLGVTEFNIGIGNVMQMATLASITGNIGRPGAGVFPLRGQNNVQGACDMGSLPNNYHGYLPVTDETNRILFQTAWQVPLSNKIGIKLSEAPDAILDGKIHGLYIFGENPVVAEADVNHYLHAIEKLDLLVVQDIFLTETARYAHIVLPAAAWGEKDGTFTNTERRVQRVRKAVNPPGQAKPDWWIFSELARRMGYNGMNYAQAQDIWDELRKLAASKFGGITYARLETIRGIPWPCPAETHAGTPVLYTGAKFSTPSGKIHLRPVLFDPNGVPDEKVKLFKEPIVGRMTEQADAEYPFILTTGRRVYHYHSGTMTRKSFELDKVGPEELVEINPADAEKLGVVDSDWIKLRSRRGEIAAKAWVTERVPAGTLFATFHYWEANCNELTLATGRDPIAGMPDFKTAAIAVARISAEEAQIMLLAKKSKYKVAMEYQVVADMQAYAQQSVPAAAPVIAHLPANNPA